jgi:hypothetical protein
MDPKASVEARLHLVVPYLKRDRFNALDFVRHKRHVRNCLAVRLKAASIHALDQAGVMVQQYHVGAALNMRRRFVRRQG